MKQDKNEIVESVLNDLQNRQKERKSFEAVWQLNMNFAMGNQHCSILNSEVEEYEKQFFWQEKEVFNHIAPILDMRFAKLQKVRPTMTVVPSSNEDSDLQTAKLCKKILGSTYNNMKLGNLISNATKWSEICGTSFYKVVWNSEKGEIVATDNNSSLRSGDVEVSLCTPFEIYPDNTCCENIDDCDSIIHAKSYHIDEIKNIYGIEVEGEDVNVFTLDSTNSSIGGFGYSSLSNKIISGIKTNNALVVEKYIKPSKTLPNGRLIIIAGNELVFDGDLPFINRKNNTRGYPFIKQVSIEQTACFWGSGIVERLIPVQRAYNAVKNRKHEYINRLSMGVLTVEDGSVDLDNLEDEGLSPGKILVYRQGSNAPRYMANTSVPADFSIEEAALLKEFTAVSGVSDMLSSSSAYLNTSGVALELLIEQDETRIAPTADKIKNCIKEIGESILRLYKQFATLPRLQKYMSDHGEFEVFCFCGSDISGEDVVFESESEITDSLAQRRSTVFELLNAGLLHNENGKLTNRTRLKVLELLGFGVWESSHDIEQLHCNKANEENLKMSRGKDIDVSEIDDHELHINEHIAYMLSNVYQNFEGKDKKLEQRFLGHIATHKKMKSLIDEMNMNKIKEI